jgi:HK97 family phage portal protein
MANFWPFGRGSIESSSPRDIEIKNIDAYDPLRNFMLYGAQDNARTPQTCLNLYDQSLAVTMPVRKIADKLAELDPVIIKDKAKITKHPILDFLKNPSSDHTQYLFLKQIATYYLVTGEFFVVYLGNEKSAPKEAYPISPQYLSHNSANGFLTQFEISGDLLTGCYYRNGQVYTEKGVGLRTLTHHRDFSTRDNSMMRGQSILISASNYARQQTLGVMHNLSVLEKGGRMSLIFHFENDMDEDEFSAVRSKVNEQYAGVANAGAIGVTAGGKLDVKNLSMTNNDMDWSRGMEMATQAVALAYNYPLQLLTVDASTFNNLATGIEMLYDDAVTPLSKVVFGGIQRDIGKRFGLGPGEILTYDEDKIPSLKRRTLDEVTKVKELGIESDNELRNRIGREDYIGGDLIYKPSQMVPVGEDVVNNDPEMDIETLR